MKKPIFQKPNRRKIFLIVLLFILMVTGLSSGETADAPFCQGVLIILDGRIYSPDAQEETPQEEGLRVWFSVNGETLFSLPFEEEHTVIFTLENGGENVVRMSGEAVCMEQADCPHQECVQMGEITRDNLDSRVLGGLIICLPHRFVVEVR